jgi:hypothetical protein
MWQKLKLSIINNAADQNGSIAQNKVIKMGRGEIKKQGANPPA